MWKYILDMGRRLLLLVEDTQRHGDTIKELQREVKELASAVEDWLTSCIAFVSRLSTNTK